MNKKDFPVPNFTAFAKEIVKNAIIIAEKESVNFFKESFFKQGFTDESFQKWENRKQPDYRAGGAILTNSGHLRESIEVAEKTNNSISIGTYAPYAKIHNEGGTINIPITKKSRKYFWGMYRETGNTKWKYMALAKKNHIVLKFPKRQFIGHSATLMKILDEELKQHIQTSFKNIPTQ